MGESEPTIASIGVLCAYVHKMTYRKAHHDILSVMPAKWKLLVIDVPILTAHVLFRVVMCQGGEVGWRGYMKGDDGQVGISEKWGKECA